MNTAHTVVLALAALWCGLAAPSHAQTPASNPPGGYQPLAPTAVNVGTRGCKIVPGNLVGQFVSKNGTYYVVETRRGRVVVNRWAPLGLPYIPPHPGQGRQALANVHPFR